ncbi:MAG: glycosyltransferase family 4 protein [Phycisphaerae bacterium]
MPSPAHRLLVLNQVAGPLMVQLLTDLSAQGMDITLVTGWIDNDNPASLPFAILPAAPLVKASSLGRIRSWLKFTCQGLFHAVRLRIPLLVTTNPPWAMLAVPALGRIFRLPYTLLIYDIYPEVAERMGMLKPNGLLARWWRNRSRKAMLHASAVVTIGRCMRKTLLAQLRPGENVDIRIIPNWADTDQIRPIPKADNPFARTHGLVDKFVVTYAGSFGATHDTESIIAAAEALAETPEIHFLLIGGGTRQAEIEAIVRDKSLPNLTLLPFQPPDSFPLALAASDAAIVCLDTPFQGLSVPSKTYSALAAGCAILAVTAPDTELALTVQEHHCGLVLPPKSPSALTAAITDLHAAPLRLQSLRSAARKAAESHFSRQAETQKWRTLILSHALV